MMKPKLLLKFCWMLALIPALAVAQTATTPQKSDTQDEEPTAPQNVSLTTKDGVTLTATYYAGPESKETPAVILVHDWGGDRLTLDGMARYLQREIGASVIVPDLRGHGQSITVANSTKTLDYKDFKKNEVATVVNDLEQCRKFLWNKNNEGKLNIEMLTIVAVGKTAFHAMAWAIADWSWPPVGGKKQGQYVKLMSLVSPFQRVEGLSIKQSLKAPLMSGKGMNPLPLQIVWANQNNTSVANAKAIYRELSKSRKKIDKLDSLTMSNMSRASQSPTGLVKANRECFQMVAQEIRKRIIENKALLAWQNYDTD